MLDVLISQLKALRIHNSGYIFILIAAFLSFLFFYLVPIIGKVGFIITAFICYFFRDPRRVILQEENLILGPADGKVVYIKGIAPPVDWGLGSEKRTCVSIFLSVFDVHVTRAPVKGKIRQVFYEPGKFLNAALDKASSENERNIVIFNALSKNDLAVVQIAGLIARRIVCNVKQGQAVEAGERIGIIRFGSRVDIYLPLGVNSLVLEGQRIIGGETVIADINVYEPRLQGKIV
ncbi:MAG: phosphatidylserine decarboxylase [Alphaproteobacteria bacterium]